MPEQIAFIFSKKEAFKLYSLIESLKFPSFVKEGDMAENDIKVPAGPTPLMAGPVIGELTKVGIPVGIEGGRIVVKKDFIIVRKGERISKDVANALKKLEIRPTLIGVDVVCFYENGKIYKREVLDLIKEFPNMLKTAYGNALNLSVFISYPTKNNISLLFGKAINCAMALNKRLGV